MSENPYQPSQVAEVASGQSLGLRRILAIAAAYRACMMNWKFYGFRWHLLLFLLAPFAVVAVNVILLRSWLFENDDDLMWLMLANMAPFYIFIFLSTWRGGVILSPRSREQRPLKDIVNSDGVLFASGVFTLKESAANYNRIFRFINRFVTGRSPVQLLLRVPCTIKQAAELKELFPSRRNNPFDDEQESEPEDNSEYWYAAGKLDPQKEPELVYQHLAFNSEPAVKIYYLDQQQRSKWLVLASLDADYLQRTLATFQQSFMITLGT